MTKDTETPAGPSRRDLFASGAALVGASLLPAAAVAQTPATEPGATDQPPAQSVSDAGATANAEARARAPAPSPIKPPGAPPAGYNILFVLVDQEHFFDEWPFPVPGREWIKQRAITFNNHQGASCVCSPARSTLYTGQHIPHTGVFDNANALWQRDMPTDVKTIGHRLTELGYHAAYQGKWHLSVNLDQVSHAIDAPFLEYREIIESYGFKDFFGVGDINDTTLGGYNYDDTTTAFATRWLRTTAQELNREGKPWYLAVNFVNPHDVMYIDSDLPGQTLQGKGTAMPIARPPENDLYRATWDAVPLPSTRTQAWNAPGRPKAHHIYQEVMDVLVGQWPDEDRRWRVLQNYYFNCIRDCDLQVSRMLEAIAANGFSDNTIIVFTADHGELGGHHQMRGKGNCTYRQQVHLPLMIVHPAYPAGACDAVTSQIDLTPTLLALTGADPEPLAKASAGLPGRDFSSLMFDPAHAGLDALRPASLFCYDMLSYQDARWATEFDVYMDGKKASLADKIKKLQANDPDFHNRCSIRSVFDGRYRFSRYFSPIGFNTPDTLEALTSQNDLELYDLDADPDETDNLAMDLKANGDLIMAMNGKMNGRLAEEVGVDDGGFLPIRDGKWHFPPASERG